MTPGPHSACLVVSIDPETPAPPVLLDEHAPARFSEDGALVRRWLKRHAPASPSSPARGQTPREAANDDDTHHDISRPRTAGTADASRDESTSLGASEMRPASALAPRRPATSGPARTTGRGLGAILKDSRARPRSSKPGSVLWK